MVTRFLDESTKKFMDYSSKSFGGLKPLVQTQTTATRSAMPTFKSCLEKLLYDPWPTLSIPTIWDSM